ncbi:hypothetical protein GH810_07350 [Acetobacterium paludosum]|uniref:Methyl-accepting chemotaxis protein n=2 Tax=Acetobacterium paludosum TaxID=52693 RepID=A0A923HUV3_9FIRM|nr:hypothetical protein [Acetobacterium paludosum]
MTHNDFTQKVECQSFGIFNNTAKSINALYLALNFVVDTINQIAMGDMQNLVYLQKAGKQSENDHLGPSMVKLIENISNLVAETEKLTISAVQGDLDNRGDSYRFQGEYAKVIEGFNSTLDAITAPIKEASVVLNQLSNGNLNVLMKGLYAGENGRMKNDINTLVKFLKCYVNEITEVLVEMSNGNLDVEITANYIGDFQTIKSSINLIAKSFNDMLAEIDVAAGQVEIGARLISEGGQALSMGTTEQSDSIQDLSSYMAEIASKTKRNAVNASEASNWAIDVQNNAEESNHQMSAMINAMADINGASNNISKIIKVIDEIAFQTNILALNAAVEAARAGQHGKGFAVVAEEVRTLAARSAEAARETTGLIEGSIEKVSVGTMIADKTAASLTEISEQIEKVTESVEKMAKSSNDQALDIDKIVNVIEQISKVVQNYSVNAEESAASSEELFSQAEMLKEMVGTFELKK